MSVFGLNDNQRGARDVDEGYNCAFNVETLPTDPDAMDQCSKDWSRWVVPWAALS